MDSVLPAHYYWAVPGQIVAGQHPGGQTVEQGRALLSTLLAMHVSAFVNLTEEGEWEPYVALAEELHTPPLPALVYCHEPIRDRTIPTEEQMVRILDRIDALLAEGRVIYLHCLAGIGRTGTVLGCHLVRHGLSGEAALQLIAKRRWGNPYADMVSPETDGQRHFVRQWEPGK